MNKRTTLLMLGLLVGSFGYVGLGFVLFGDPTMMVDHCPESAFSCPSQTINPNADLVGWAALFSPFALAALYAKFLDFKEQVGERLQAEGQ